MIYSYSCWAWQLEGKLTPYGEHNIVTRWEVVQEEGMNEKKDRLYKTSCLVSMILTLAMFKILIDYGIPEISGNNHDKAIMYAIASGIFYIFLQKVIVMYLQKMRKFFENL